MTNIHRIVAATDFSIPADRAVRRAGLIAQAQQAELHLLHVVHPLALYPGLEFGPGDLVHHDRIIEAGARTRLDALADKLHADLGIEVRAATRIGRAHTEIAAHAQQIEAGLVVVGARGENTLLDLLLGSTAARVLRVATCPVLIVKLQTQPAPYRDAIVALDLSAGYASAPALCRAVAPQARIELLHIHDTTLNERMRQAGLEAPVIEDYLERARSAAQTRLDGMVEEAALAGPVSRQVMVGYPAAAIVERVKSLRADLAVLGRSGKSGRQEFLLGSVAKDVANAADCDVLVLSPTATETGQ